MTGDEAKNPRILRALRFAWESAPGWTLAGMALLLVQGVLPLLSLYLMKRVVDTAVSGLTAADRTTALTRLMLYVALSGAVALAGTLCGALSRLVSGAQSRAVMDHMNDVIHAQSIAVDLEYYENSRYYDTLHRTQREAPYRPTRIVNGLMQIGQGLLALLGIAALLLSLHWSIGLILLAAAVPGALARSAFAHKMYVWQQQQTPSERQAWYINWLLTRDTSAKEIRLFGLGPLFARRFTALCRQLRGEQLQIETQRSMAEIAAGAIEVGAAFGLYAYVGCQTLRGSFTIGDLVMYFQAVQRTQSFLGQVLGSFSELYESQLFLSSFFEFLELKPKVVGPPCSVPIRLPAREGLVFDHVSFQYPGSARMALEEISLTIRPGEHIALVGENGAGKSTLIKLLCRLYDPTAGVIRLEGVDLREYDITALRRQLSVVFQDYTRYQLTAQENIWLGNVESPPDQGQIVAAARQAGADEVIARLRDGYETPLGKWFEGGEELSVGEWQKMALARAFLRDAPIIVLDEPTSAIDARAEYELFQRFHRLTEGRIAILISHRLSTVRMAHRIYVLEQGRVAESGTHDELISRGERYAHLFETQAQYYR